MINPSWLKYDKFDADGVDYIKYDSLSELPERIMGILDGTLSVNAKRNAEILYSEYSWEAVKGKWLKVFNG